MKKILIYFLKALCALALFIGLQQIIELQTRGFYLKKISESDLIAHRNWDVPELSKEEQNAVLSVLDQPFTFLGAGSECFAFLGDDQTTVIKFFKFDTFRPIYFFRGLFSEDRGSSAGTISSLYPRLSHFFPGIDGIARRMLGMREYRIGRTFNSLKLSYDNLKEETGLIYLHLNPTDSLHKKGVLYDPSGIAHEIDLDTARFYLQKRAIPLEKHFLALKKNKEHERARQCVASLCAMIRDRCGKGFADRDPYNKNFGFIDDRAIEMDTGSFLPNPRMKEKHFFKQELIFVTLELRRWAENNYPELLPVIASEVAQEIGREL
jgi:hypothetical protein